MSFASTRLGRMLDSVATALERERIRGHLALVETELRARDPPLAADPDRREAYLDALREYWMRGEFPTNRDFDERTPYFRDADGVRCAVGELAARDGRHDVVETVSREDNHVDLETDDLPPALATWLEDAPLTEEEATTIQPGYGRPEPTLFTEGNILIMVASVIVYVAVLRLLYGGVGDWFPDNVPAQVGTFVTGSLAALLVVSFGVFVVVTT